MLGRSGYHGDGLSLARSLLLQEMTEMLDSQGWIHAPVLARAISLDVDLESLNKSVISVQGVVTSCHGSPVCLDLACGKCFDPLTSMSVSTDLL